MHVRHFAAIRDRFVRRESDRWNVRIRQIEQSVVTHRSNSSIRMTGLVGIHIAVSNGEILSPNREMQIRANRVTHFGESESSRTCSVPLIVENFLFRCIDKAGITPRL